MKDSLDQPVCDFDEALYDIDWEEIIATTQDDFLAGRFAFNSADYPNDAAAMAAMEQLLDDILEEVLRETAAVRPPDAAR